MILVEKAGGLHERQGRVARWRLRFGKIAASLVLCLTAFTAAHADPPSRAQPDHDVEDDSGGFAVLRGPSVTRAISNMASETEAAIAVVDLDGALLRIQTPFFASYAGVCETDTLTIRITSDATRTVRHSLLKPYRTMSVISEFAVVDREDITLDDATLLRRDQAYAALEEMDRPHLIMGNSAAGVYEAITLLEQVSQALAAPQADQVTVTCPPAPARCLSPGELASLFSLNNAESVEIPTLCPDPMHPIQRCLIVDLRAGALLAGHWYAIVVYFNHSPQLVHASVRWRGADEWSVSGTRPLPPGFGEPPLNSVPSSASDGQPASPLLSSP